MGFWAGMEPARSLGASGSDMAKSGGVEQDHTHANERQQAER